MSQPEPMSGGESSPPFISRLRVWLWRLGIAAWLAVMVFALVALHGEWSRFHLDDLNEALSRLGWKHVALAIGCTALGYLCNAAIDLFSLRWLGKKIPVTEALGCSYIAAAFSI
ncbi:MAG: hypothetical protein EOP88_11605, partial [Verrucomicrobiaceae bacterium]